MVIVLLLDVRMKGPNPLMVVGGIAEPSTVWRKCHGIGSVVRLSLGVVVGGDVWCV
jgi:hypothetical protein